MFIEKIHSSSTRTYLNGKGETIRVPLETKLEAGQHIFSNVRGGKWSDVLKAFITIYKRNYTVLTIQPKGA